MKTFALFFFSLFTLPLFAETWEDPDTGYKWDYWTNENNEVGITGVSIKWAKSLTIPSQIDGKNVTDVELRCNDLRNVVIPEHVKRANFGIIGTGDALWSMICLGDVIFHGGIAQPYGGVFYSQKYRKNWEKELSRSDYSYGVTDSMLLASVFVKAKMVTPKQMHVTYKIKGNVPRVRVRAVAFRNGTRSLANIIPIRTGVNVPNGEIVSTNEEYSFTWDIASDWDTDLNRVSVEILVAEENGRVIPQDLIQIPSTDTHEALTITRNVLSGEQILAALYWYYAASDPSLSVSDGILSINGIALPNTPFVGEGFFIYDSSELRHLMNYLYGKVGFRILEGDELEYVNTMLRDELVDYHSTRDYYFLSVKIEEE